MNKKLQAAIFVLLITLPLTLTACGGSGDSADSTQNAQTSGTAGTAGTTAEADDPFDSLADDAPVYGSEYVYDDYSPYIRVKSQEKLTVSRQEAERLADEYFSAVLAQFKNFVDAPEDAAIAMNDQATIYYKGYSADPEFTISEEVLANMTNNNSESGHDLVIGSNSFIVAYESEEHPENNNPGFEEQLIGAKAGECVTITVTFPDVYNSAPELQGRPVKFDVKIVKIMNPDPNNPTELTDEIANQFTNGQYATAESLRNAKMDEFKSQLAYEVLRDRIEVYSYPQDVYNRLLDSYMSTYVSDDTTEEDRQALLESGDKAVKEILDEELMLNYLYKENNITLTKSEYLSELQKVFDENSFYLLYGYGISSVDDMEGYFTRDYWISYFKSVKLSKHLIEIAQWDDEPAGDQ